MNRKQIETLIRQYFQSWLQQDLSLFLSTMTTDVVIIECYGPAYHGTDEVRKWFVEWHKMDGKGKVTKWEILDILYDNEKQVATVEWDFECIFFDNLDSFLGASLFRFRDSKISSIQEFKMEKEQYRPFKGKE